ncbi:HTH-type transcriptional regulator ZntR [Oligella urethralis]|uniref:Cd(II)/Pb(II)-responsive transcriptional regulator n=1 Tax=Oligella urethralis TaxID=90245 RepID=UPI000CFF2771|nr:Cd(II)/Pb(II)-responsive transcriptional regulator [Oligella urethralis]AVL71875.1 Cd(II)/Pb(II)-responsive transcriptional regulator [Oligella urethralis]WOS38598.1 HTH-type transcriptional regulator ZntR [Oligella urethralis]
MKIGELSKLANCPVETIRYYEREGLLPEAPRNLHNNYREYQQKHLERLIFIRRCRTLEMSQDEIRKLLVARVEPNASCASVNALIDRHLVDVNQRIKELSALAEELAHIRSQCGEARAARDCGILHELERLEF